MAHWRFALLPFELLVYLAASLLDLVNHFLPLFELLVHILHGALEHQPLRAAEAF